MSASSIEILKSTIPIEAIIGTVVEFKNGKALCPFHSEKTPSFSIKRNRFRCFACGEAGDVIDFIKKHYNLSTGEAIKYLADWAGLKLGRPEPARIVEDKEKQELVGAFRSWVNKTENLIAEALRRYRHMRAVKSSFTEAEIEVLAQLQEQVNYLEFIYEILCGTDDESKFQLFVEEFGV